jgi:hypothetical protein
MTSLEECLREAKRLANGQRRSKGLPSMDYEETTRADGTKWVGPTRYKITLFIDPWHYVDLVTAAGRGRKTMSPTGLITKLIEEHVPHVAARPKKKKLASVTPIRKAATASTSRSTERKIAAVG